MPRTFSSAVQSEIAKNVSHAIHLLTFGPVNGTSYYFAEDQVNGFLGHNWLPNLLADFTVKLTQKLQLDPVTVKLQNIDLAMAAILNAQQSAIQGVEAKLYRFWPTVNDYVVLFDGVVTEMDVNEQTVQLVLAGDLDPTASQVPARQYQALCPWKFKSTQCGYAGTVFTTCPKDFPSCIARGQWHRFGGFIHITPDVTAAIQGQLPSPQPATIQAVTTQPWEQV